MQFYLFYLLLVSLGSGVVGLTGGVDWAGVAVGPGLTRSNVATGQNLTLAVSTEGTLMNRVD